MSTTVARPYRLYSETKICSCAQLARKKSHETASVAMPARACESRFTEVTVVAALAAAMPEATAVAEKKAQPAGLAARAFGLLPLRRLPPHTDAVAQPPPIPGRSVTPRRRPSPRPSVVV
jgi:hypothetical protein